MLQKPSKRVPSTHVVVVRRQASEPRREDDRTHGLPVWNLIDGHKRKGVFAVDASESKVAECAIIGHPIVERITLRKVTGYFLVSSISHGGRGRRSKEALRRRAAAADARGWTKQRRKAMQ